MSEKIRQIFNKSIGPYSLLSGSVRSPQERKKAAEATVAAEKEGFLLISPDTLPEEQVTKLMIKELNSGVPPLVVGIKYDVQMVDMVMRIAKFAMEQGEKNGEFLEK